MTPHHEGSIRRPIAPLANALTTELSFCSVVYQFEFYFIVDVVGCILIALYPIAFDSKRISLYNIHTKGLKLSNFLLFYPQQFPYIAQTIYSFINVEYNKEPNRYELSVTPVFCTKW